jgi:hypothetical protein
MRFRFELVGAMLLLALSGGLASAQTAPSAPVVSYPSSSALSPSLSDLPVDHSSPTANALRQIPSPKRLHPHGAGPQAGAPGDEALQRQPGPTGGIQAKTKFGGIGANCCIPPDPNIAVGLTNVVQVVNSRMAVYNKSGSLLTGPVTLSSLWTNLGGICAASNSGDVIAQYDVVADRWLIAQLGSVSGPAYSECIAVSQTNNPSGAYYLYSYCSAGPTPNACANPPSTVPNYLNDYPKFGVWPTANNSAYLASYNLFDQTQPANSPSSLKGANLCAYDRAAMLRGDGISPSTAPKPTEVCFTTTAPTDQGYLPVDLDGARLGVPLPDGTPAYFMNLAADGVSLGLYEVDGLTFPSGAHAVPTYAKISGVSAYSDACGSSPVVDTCIVQPNSQALDALGDRLMYRLAYRVFSDHAAVVVNHSITSGSSVGARWYELRQPLSTSGLPTGTFSLYQQGTFAPDSAYRWMGSAAMDGAGDIALGYSKSSSSINPALAFTSRTPTTPSGMMATEQVMQAGSAAQSTYSRWGDYSSLRIDPSDDTTFWYTNEYYTSGLNGFLALWSTAIGSFTVASSGQNSDFGVSVSPTSIIVRRGSNAKTTVSVTGVTGSNNVSLSIGGLPSRASASFNPATISVTGTSTGASALTVTAGSRTPLGNYTTTITGSNGTTAHTTTLLLTIQ